MQPRNVQNENWVKSYWRPAMGWLYMAICAFDFIIFPFIMIMYPVMAKIFDIAATYTPWTSLTLTNGGLIHMAFGAILGVTAWTRGQERLNSPPPPPPSPPTPPPPRPPS